MAIVKKDFRSINVGDVIVAIGGKFRVTKKSYRVWYGSEYNMPYTDLISLETEVVERPSIKDIPDWMLPITFDGDMSKTLNVEVNFPSDPA